jgi:large subunit ribosomal protein L35
LPKLKTHKGAAARFRITRTGKVLRMKGQAGHMRRKKPSRVKRQYSGTLTASPADVPRIKRLLGK